MGIMRNDERTEEVPGQIVFPSIQPGEQDDLTFLDVLLIITQRKKLAGIVTAACTAIALLIAFALPQEYTATVIILPPQGNSSMSSMLAGQLAMKRTQLSTGMVQVDGQARAMIDSAAHLRAQIVSKEVQIEAMRSYAGDENPALTQAQTELDGLRSQFNKMVGSKGGSSDDLFLPKGEVPQAGLEYVRRLRDVKYYVAIFDVLARQLELAKMDEAREGAFIQIVDAAVPPEKRSFPKRGMLTISGLSVGFTLGIMLALLQGGLVRMRHNPATKDKLDLLKCSLWMGRAGMKSKPTQEEVGALRHARPEATG